MIKEDAKRIFEIQKELDEIAKRNELHLLEVETVQDTKYKGCNGSDRIIKAFPSIIIEVRDPWNDRFREVVSITNCLEQDQEVFDRNVINQLECLISKNINKYRELKEKEREIENTIIENVISNR